MCSYAMLIKRWYFPIFIFVGLGKVAGGFHGIGGEIRRPPGSNDKPVYYPLAVMGTGWEQKKKALSYPHTCRMSTLYSPHRDEII